MRLRGIIGAPVTQAGWHHFTILPVFSNTTHFFSCIQHMVQQRNPVHKAVVKNVLSGDTVILRGKPRPNGPPLERLLALSNVQAPRLGNKERDDEVYPIALLFFTTQWLTHVLSLAFCFWIA